MINDLITNPLVSPSQAEALIESALPLTTTETVALVDAIGRRLAQTVVADRNLPPYPRAMMDGIAFSSDSPGPFVLQGLHAAGDPPPPPLKPGHAWEIMTGASLPHDCDTVVPYEDLSQDRSKVTGEWIPGQCVHLAGGDASKGHVLIGKGTCMGAPEVAIAASVGLSTLEVFRLPRVALISSGNEAVAVDAIPEEWQIRRSNGPMLEALLRHGDVPVVSHVHVDDDEDPVREALKNALQEAELIIICGGISKGKKDFMRPVVEEFLGKPLFHGVAQKPGKPLAAWVGPPVVFALPGNPVSVMATFSRYVVPAIKRLAGDRALPLMKPCPPNLQSLPHLTWLLALDASGSQRLASNSGDFCSLSGASGFLEVPAGEALTESSQLQYYPTTLKS